MIETPIVLRANKQIGTKDIEAVVRRCSSKWLLLKISQYSQENTCVEVFFNKVVSPKARVHFERKKNMMILIPRDKSHRPKISSSDEKERSLI